MRKKAFSIVFVPHSKAGSKTFTVSKRGLKSSAIIIGLCGLLLLGFLADYFTMSHTRANYKKLVKETQAQTQTLKEYEANVGQLKKKVESLDNYVKKLNIMSGLKADGIKEVGVGDGSSSYVGILPQTRWTASRPSTRRPRTSARTSARW
jgi:cell division protein FtsB